MRPRITVFVLAAVLGGCPARSGFEGSMDELDPGDDDRFAGTGDGSAPADGGGGDEGGDGIVPGDGLDPTDDDSPPNERFRFEYDRTWVVLQSDAPMTPLTPVVGSTATFTVAPALPTGLTLGVSTGVISGTPTAITPPFSEHVVTATTAVASRSTLLRIAVLQAFVVDTTADLAPGGTLGDGVCGQPGQCSVRAALAEADAVTGTQVVIVPAGTYAIASQLTLGADALAGSRAGTTLIDGAGLTAPAFTQAASLASYIADVEVRGVNSNTLGGGLAADGDLMASHLFIHDCLATRGAGASLGSVGTMNVERSTFTGNQALESGAGLYAEGTTNLFVTTSTFANNTAGDVGAGVGFFGSSGYVRRSFFGQNSAVNGAGAIYVANIATVAIDDSTFEANLANAGGALMSQGQLAVRYSTFASNTSNAPSNVLAVQAGLTTWRGNLMLFQPAPCDDNDGAANDAGYNVFDGPLSACVWLDAATDRLNASTTDIDNNAADNGGDTMTIQIGASSAAADLGDTDCSRIDQRGEPRPTTPGPGSATCDAGAYEVSVGPQ